MQEKPKSELRKFVAPDFLFGTGARHRAGDYAATLGISTALVVTDPGVMEAGWTNDVVTSLRACGIAPVVFSDITPNPKDHEVAAGTRVFLEAECDGIVAVGGGSPMDCAKGIGVMVAESRDILEFEGVNKVTQPPPPLICIPTTAGSAAEVSQFAIITDTVHQKKIAIISKALVPDMALIDPETTLTMDPFLTACTGIDALVHAVEAAVSNARSPITDLHALKAVELVDLHLEKAIRNPEDIMYREGMLLASLEAGLAFSNASLGAVHAMAHSLGGFNDSPHGECNALLLEHVAAYNFTSAEEAFRGIARVLKLEEEKMTAAVLSSTLIDRFRRLRTTAGINFTLKDLGITPQDIPRLARNAATDPCLLTNPQPLSQKEIERIYEKAL